MKINETLEEQIALLLRALKSERFHFILIQHNHSRIREMVKKRIAAAFPDRDARSIRVAGHDYRSLVDTIYAQKNGFVYLDDFDYLLDHSEIYIAFNQRRDKLSQLPIALIAFLPTSAQGLKKAVRNIPDLWSLRNLTLELEGEAEPPVQVRGLDSPDSQLGRDERDRRERELTRLRLKLEEMTHVPENVPAIDNLYLQILDACDETGAYRQGYEYAADYLEFATQQNYRQRLPLAFAEALNRRAKFARHLGQYEPALRDLNEAMQIAHQPGNESTQLQYLNDLGLVYKDMGRYQEAVGLFKSAINRLQEWDDKHPALAAFQANLALAYMQLGDFVQAERLLKMAIDADMLNFGPSHPVLATRYNNLAWVYANQQDWSRALPFFQVSYDISLEKLGPEHPQTLSAKRFRDEAQEKLRGAEAP